MKVIIMQDDDDPDFFLAFSSEEKVLGYFQELYPQAKSLRISRQYYLYRLFVFNHRYDVGKRFGWKLFEVEVDKIKA